MPTLIALLIFAAWSVFAFLKPKTAFSYLPFALPFYLVRLSIGPLPTTALEIVVLATIAGMISNVGARSCAPLRETWASVRPWALPCGLWLLAGAVSVIVAPDHLAALGLYRAYFIEPIAIFFVGLSIMGLSFRIPVGSATRGEESQDELKNLIQSKSLPRSFPRLWRGRNDLTRNLFLLTILFGCWAVFQYATGIGLPAEYAPLAIRRAVGPFPYPNALALFVVPITALAFARAVASHAYPEQNFGESRVTSKNEGTIGQSNNQLIKQYFKDTWLEWGTVLAGLTAVLLAKSDGGLFAIIAAIFIALIMNKRTRLATIAIATIGAIAIFAIPQARTPVLNQILFKEWSGKVRVIMWKETVAMLKDRPIFGAGLAAYPDAIQPYHKATWMEIFQYPHNILLNFWSETGILGVVAFGWLLAAWLRPDVHRDAALVLPILIALLVHGLVDVPYFKNDIAILFFLLILITVKPSNDQTKQKTESIV